MGFARLSETPWLRNESSDSFSDRFFPVVRNSTSARRVAANRFLSCSSLSVISICGTFGLVSVILSSASTTYPRDSPKGKLRCVAFRSQHKNRSLLAYRRSADEGKYSTKI